MSFVEVKEGDRVYFAAPYSAKREDGSKDVELIERRMTLLSQCVMKLIDTGTYPVSPLYMHYVMKAAESKGPTDWTFWQGYSHAMLQDCDVMIVLMMDHWRESEGVQAEIAHADRCGIPVLYFMPQDILSWVTVENDNG